MRRLSIIILLLCQAFITTGLLAQTPSNYEDRIRQKFRANKWKEGNVIVDSALNDYPQVAAFYELKGQYILHETPRAKDKTKSYDLARYYLIQSINLDEKNLNSRRLLLRIETETKHYSSAIVYCNELMEENPYNEHLWRTKIDLYRKLGNDVEADRLLERIATIYPEDSILRRDIAYRKQTLMIQQKAKGDLSGMEQSLRKLIDLEPANAENYIALVNLLYSNGRASEAAEVAERGVSYVHNGAARETLIAKRVSMLTEMNRYSEAMGYLSAMQKKYNSAYLHRLQTEVGLEAARAARMNDPYEAYAKVYDSQHSSEALDYLVGTSIQRNYYDDALYYIQEARRHGDSPKLLYSEYTVHKRMGNKQKAERLLEELHQKQPNNMDVATELAEIYLGKAAALMSLDQYKEAIPILEQTSTMNADPELLQATLIRLINCYMQTNQKDKAELALENYNSLYTLGNYTERKAAILHAKGHTKEALELLAAEYRACTDSMVQRREDLSVAYEEIAVPYIKNMMAAGMFFNAKRQIQEALEICPNSDDILRYAISASMALKEKKNAQELIVQGMERFPGEPFYKLKNAQMMAADRQYSASIDSLRILLDTYPGDSTIVNAFSECCENLAIQYMRANRNDMAIAVLDTALYFDNLNHSLLYTKYLVYRKMKDWKNAELCLMAYKPDFRELAGHRRSLEEIYSQQMNNGLSFEYQEARLGNEDAITGNAYLSYTRKMQHLNRRGQVRHDVLTVGMAYAGRDGTADAEVESEQTKGGTGVMLSANWEHQFTERFTANAGAAWSSRYFPTFTVNLGAAYDMRRNWQLTARANFRWLKTFKGIYQMTHEFAGYDPYGAPIYADVMKLSDWDVKHKPMVQVGVGANKTFGIEGRFNLSGGVDAFLLSSNFYINGNAKVQFFPFQDKHSYFYATGGVGTAPESSLIDQSLAVGFSNLNTFVGMGGSYFVNRWLSLNLSGSWYTMLTQKETLSLPLIGTTAQIKKNYGNYFYIHAAVVVRF